MFASVVCDLRARPANDVRCPAEIDPVVERAIALMQAQLTAGWTVARLAKATGCSRAVFARRFAAATGVTPLAFLRFLRMHEAVRHLACTSLGLAAIAGIAGYATEFAFGRAFKRIFRVSPGRFRRSWMRRQGPFELRSAA